MVGLGATELIVLGFLCLFFFVGLILAILALASIVSQKKREPAAEVRRTASQAYLPRRMPAEDRDSQIDLVARITRRFCPQCRAPLDSDSPQGL